MKVVQLMKLATLACVALLVQSHVCSQDQLDLNMFSKSSISKILMEVGRKPNPDSCIKFSIRMMHLIADENNNYASVNEFTPNLEEKSIEFLSGLNHYRAGEKTNRIALDFISSCVYKLKTKPITDMINQYLLGIPFSVYSEAMMKMNPEDDLFPQCEEFSRFLLEGLVGNGRSFGHTYIDAQHALVGKYLEILGQPDLVQVPDMPAEFKTELADFVNQCNERWHNVQ